MRRLLGSPAATWRQFAMTVAPRERALRANLQNEMKRVAVGASAAVLHHMAVDSGIEAHYRHVHALLRAAYHEGMPVFGKPIIDAGSKARRAKPYEPLVIDWINKVSLSKAQQISRTTREQLRNILARGQQEGQGTGAIARAIREDFGDIIGRARSETIARTEMHGAANAAQYIAADSLGVAMQREWIAADDERTRDDHAEASGQTVGMDEPFEVGGEELMQPGDPSGSPEQIINCRCTTGFIVIE